MKLPVEVLEDLLIVYAAGEASTATRILVEDYLRAHPEAARRVNAPLPEPQQAMPPPDACLKSLNATKRLTLLRLGVLGFAITTLVIPLHPFFWDNKTFVITAECASSTAWGLFVFLSERIRRAGLR